MTPTVFDNVFGWPLSGEVTEKFGSLKNSALLKGVVIESGITDRILAAGDGKVALTDQALKGYGKTIIVEHSDIYSTVYAGNTKILVTPGQIVHRGDLIAIAGKTDRVGRSRLYFELRKNLKVEDPLQYLK